MKAKVANAWPASDVVIAASGPSLVEEDLSLIKDRFKLIVINTTFRLAPWAEALYAMDSAWYRHHHKELSIFQGARYSMTAGAMSYGATPLAHIQGFLSYSHSGAGAISLAMLLGARKILLLGYDGKASPEGKVHWHGDHPKGLSNAGSMQRWSKNLALVANTARARKVSIINCSRATVYECFPVATLGSQLA